MLNLDSERVGIFVFVSHDGEKKALRGKRKSRSERAKNDNFEFSHMPLESVCLSRSRPSPFNPFFNQPLMSVAPNSSPIARVCSAIVLNICDRTSVECLLMGIDDGNKFPYMMTVCVYIGDYN